MKDQGFDYRIAVGRSRADAAFFAKQQNDDRPAGYHRATLVQRSDGKWDVYCVPDGHTLKDVKRS